MKLSTLIQIESLILSEILLLQEEIEELERQDGDHIYTPFWATIIGRKKRRVASLYGTISEIRKELNTF
jgi:hypothetical protein